MATRSKRSTVHFVSLGCPKNRVDSEVMLGHLVHGGFQVVDRPDDAEVIVVNTCGFIDAAKQESVDVILDMAQFKTSGSCRKLVVTGCLSQRYAPELAREIPEVDHFLGTGNFDTIAEVLGGAPAVIRAPSRLPLLREVAASDEGHRRERGNHQPPRIGRPEMVPYRHEPAPGAVRPVRVPAPRFTITAESPRVRTTPPYTAYVKIAEGCSNSCSFCIIPRVRGAQRSRPVADIVAEVERLADQGAVEINLIAQDLCAYGRDLPERPTLAQLLRALDRVGQQLHRPFWIRCLYMYPRGLTRETIDVIAGSAHVLPYVDIPLQHISDRVLRRMQRGKGAAATRQVIERLRQGIPGLTLRTAFITGFPGEMDADFDELYRFVEEVRFERLGVFTFSAEEDTPAAGFTGQVPAELAAERRDRLMELQQRISRQQQRAMVGRTLDVLVEGVSEETDLLLASRHAGQAPDIDGLTYINDGVASPGEVVRVLVDQAGDYDLVGGIVAPDCEPRPRRRRRADRARPSCEM